MTSILYLDTIFYGYFGDDFWLIKYNLTDVFNETFYGVHFRPLWYLSYYLTNLFFHSSVFDHFVNLILFFIVIKMSFDYVLGFFDKKKSLIIMVLWVTLPWLLFPVTWISQRNDLLMIIFILLSIKQFEKGNTITSSVYMIFGFFLDTHYTKS